MILLLACTSTVEDTGPPPVEGAAYEGPVSISQGGLSCLGSASHYQVGTTGVPDAARVRLPELDEEHDLRLDEVDAGGWWSLWSVVLSPGEYLPGSTTGSNCAVEPILWELEILVDGELIDSCQEGPC